MTESPVKMKGIDRSEVALSSSTISSEESMGGCSLGCFSVSNTRPASADTSYTSRGEGSLGGGVKLGGGAEVVRSESAKSGRHCNSTYKEGRVDNWKVGGVFSIIYLTLYLNVMYLFDIYKIYLIVYDYVHSAKILE